MRVCLVNLWDKSGMLHYSLQLANALAKCPGVSTWIILPASARESAGNLLDKSVKAAFIDVITEASWHQFIKLPLYLLQLPQFYKIIKDIQPDIIHVTSAHIWMVLTLPGIVNRYAVVSTIHDVKPHPGLDNTFRKRLEIRTLVEKSRALFVHGDELKKDLLAGYPFVNGEQVHVVPHGDYAFFTRWSTGAPEEPKTLLFFGRIRDYKGLPDLVAAHQKVVQVFPDAKLVIAGEGALGALSSVIASSSNYEVHNRFIADEEVAAFFERASIVVCPYLEASQSGVIPVAYAFKKPVIATRVGSLPESVKDGVTGLLVPSHAPDQLAQAIVRLLADPSLRKQMGENAYQQMLTGLSWDEIARKSLAVYQLSV